jgi:dienelactone hydrolase
MAWRWFSAGLLAACLLSAAAAAQEIVHFPSLDPQHTMLDGYLFRPAAAGRRPAVVFLHGCGGLVSRSTGALSSRETDWARRLNATGYGVLLVDSFTPRRQGEMCSAANYDASVYARRAQDAYGALAYLQAQDAVSPDRVGVIGWSQGGGTVLNTIGTPSLGRPVPLARPDFRAAVAFYPALCSDKRLSAAWTTTIPLLVLVGDGDVWTPAAPCQSVLAAAVSRGARVTMQVYPGAFHDFDWPNLPRRDRPEFKTPAGVVPITGTDPAARADAQQRVSGFFAQYLGN